MRQQGAVGSVAQLFRGDPAQPLDEAADDLAAIDGGVDRSAEVHEEIDAQYRDVAGEAIDDDLGGGAAVGVIEERTPLAGVAIEIDAGSGVVAALAEADTLFVGQGDELGKAETNRGPTAIEDLAGDEF